MTYVTECNNPKSVTIFIRGGTDHFIDEVERAIKDSLGDIASAVTDGKVVSGAGSTETLLSKKLREFANSMSGREQLAALAFADSIEIIPKTLAENAGLDPIDILTDSKSKHDAGQNDFGIDVFTGKVKNSWEEGVIEPLKVKTQAIKSASEVTDLILRIDDIIASKGDNNQPPIPGQGMSPDMMM